MGLQVIEMRARPVNLGGNVVSGPMGEILAESRLADDGAGRIVMEFNTEGMFRASRVAGEGPVVEIYRPHSAT